MNTLIFVTVLSSYSCYSYTISTRFFQLIDYKQEEADVVTNHFSAVISDFVK